MSPAKPALAEIGGEASLTLEMVPVKFKDNLSSKNLCVQLRRPVILSKILIDLVETFPVGALLPLI
jgi:hypothetical protein